MRTADRDPQPRKAAAPQAKAPTPKGLDARLLALQRTAGNRVARRMLSRWVKHPDPEQKGVMVPDSTADAFIHFNPPKNE